MVLNKTRETLKLAIMRYLLAQTGYNITHERANWTGAFKSGNDFVANAARRTSERDLHRARAELDEQLKD
jgi:hypothetical protein